MSGTAVMTVADDRGLPALDQALDGGSMLRLVARAAGLGPDDADRLRCDAEVISHKPGRRCTIRYRLLRPGDVAEATCAAVVIGKLYRSRRRAARMHERMQALRYRLLDAPHAPSVPVSLLLVEQLGVVLQEHVEGADLRHSLARGEYEAPLSSAAMWLARLHATPPVDGLKVMSLEHELEKASRWCDQIAPYLSSAESMRLCRARSIFDARMGGAHPYTPAMIHKDFYYAHVWWDGHRARVLDFDQLSIGDPAFDVGHFLAHLERQGYRTTGSHHAFTRPAAAFLSSYLDSTPVALSVRVPLYKAYTFLKLAATELARQRAGWRRSARVLAALACLEIEASRPREVGDEL